MLLVLFQLGNNRYALEANRVVEVLPLLALKRLPQSPRGIAGIFVYRGHPVPALDLCELTLGRSAHEYRSTRILLVRYHRPAGDTDLIGLIAERITGTLRREEKDFVNAGLNMEASPFLGPALLDELGVIQLLDTQRLLEATSQRLLLPHFEEAKDASD